MDKLILKLLDMEHMARESLAEIEQEQLRAMTQIEPEVARHVQEIWERTNREIEGLKRDGEAVLQAELAAIENEYLQKAESIRELFRKNGPVWQEEWNPVLTTGVKGFEAQ